MGFSSRTGRGSSQENSSSSSSSSSEDSDPSMVSPPDGGWGWVIVASVFITNLIADGVSYSFGVLFLDLQDYFQDTHSKLSWIGSTLFAVSLLAGPIASAVINKFGCRWTCTAGAVMSAVGCLLSVFATSSEYLCVSFGVISGLGLSFIYTPSVVIVAFYFEKRRAFATGLSVSGSGVGTFVIPQLIEYLQELYGWRGTFMLLAGFFLNIVVCAALLRPIENRVQRQRRQSSSPVQSEPNIQNSGDDFHVDSARTGNSVRDHISTHRTGRRFTENSEKILQLLCKPVTHSLILLPTYLYEYDNPKRSPGSVTYASGKINATARDSELNDSECDRSKNIVSGVPTDCKESYISHQGNGGIAEKGKNAWIQSQDDTLVLGENYKNAFHNTAPLEVLASHPSPDGNGDNERPDDFQIKSRDVRNSEVTPISSTQPLILKDEHRQSRHHHHHHHRHPNQFPPMCRRDVFYTGSLIRLDQFVRTRSNSCPQLFIKASSAENDDGTEDKMVGCCRWKYARRDVIKEMLDVSIFRSVKYTIFFISNFLLFAWNDVPYFYLPHYCTNVGLSDGQASMAIAVIGITNMVGQIFFGLIADSPKVNSSIVYGVSLLICGASVLFYPLCTSFATICINSVIFGFFIGANESLCSIIIVEVLSLYKLTNAYGIMTCGQGVANLIGPPFAGFFYDLTGSYLVTFASSGGFIVFSGFLLFIIALIQIRGRRKKQHIVRHRVVCPDKVSSVGSEGADTSLLEIVPTGAVEESA